ncbi:MAG: hypothetical protein IPI67_17450 [Myxococcales bacterium]|nr:hypothetical protein [Myxococcales bacterium]
MLGRRQFLWFAGATLATAATGSRIASASIARAVSLKELVRESERALIGTCLSAESRYESVGGRRRIVTHSRIRVEEALGGADDASEVMLRTLGGRVGDIGQVVHGEAMLLIGEPAFLFLTNAGAGHWVVTAMAQGHFPIRSNASGERRVYPSPRVAELRGAGAATQLVGRVASEAGAIVRKAWLDAR